MITVQDVVESIGNLSVLDLLELTDALKEKYNLTIATETAPTELKVVEEVVDQDEFEIHLIKITDLTKKIPVIKLVREITGLGLAESKKVVDSAPSKLKEFISKSDAEMIKSKLEAEGAVIEIK